MGAGLVNPSRSLETPVKVLVQPPVPNSPSDTIQPAFPPSSNTINPALPSPPCLAKNAESMESGIKWTEALENVGGDEEFLFEILCEVMDEIGTNMIQIEEARKSLNSKDASIYQIRESIFHATIFIVENICYFHCERFRRVAIDLQNYMRSLAEVDLSTVDADVLVQDLEWAIALMTEEAVTINEEITVRNGDEYLLK